MVSAVRLRESSSTRKLRNNITPFLAACVCGEADEQRRVSEVAAVFSVCLRVNAVCKRRRLKQANLEHRQHKSANDIGKLERSSFGLLSLSPCPICRHTVAARDCWADVVVIGNTRPPVYRWPVQDQNEIAFHSMLIGCLCAVRYRRVLARTKTVVFVCLFVCLFGWFEFDLILFIIKNIIQ